MDLESAAIFGNYISKEYAKDIFGILLTYQNISASEAASRLNLHIKTVQDFLEAMTHLGIITRKEVYEKKRPYFRYSLSDPKIKLEIDLNLLHSEALQKDRFSDRIREKSNSGARFTTARYDQYISSVVIWTGEGRSKKERRINLTEPQGRFLFNLPFPNARAKTIAEIMKNASVDSKHEAEILDIVNFLIEYGVIEREH